MPNPYPTVSNCIKSSFTWYDGSGHFGSRLFWGAVGAPWTVADLTTFATNIATAWGTNLKQDVANSYSLTQVQTQDISSTAGNVGVWQGSTSGTAGINEMPANCAVNIRSIIAEHYRGGHPVFHHPAASSTQLSSPRLWTGTFTTGVRTHFTAFLAAVEAGSAGGITTITHVALRGYVPGAASSAVVKWPPVNYLVNTKVGSMRRRL